MTRDEALARIRPHERELRAAGLAALYLFGSTARDEAGVDSDVDLLCELDTHRNLGLFEFMDIQDLLTSVAASKIDLVERRGLRPRIPARVEPDMVRVF